LNIIVNDDSVKSACAESGNSALGGNSPGIPPSPVEAAGKVTHGDYQTVLIPRAQAMMAKGPLRMIYVIGKDFTGYELGALWG
jgi:hypothetical protein